MVAPMETTCKDNFVNAIFVNRLGKIEIRLIILTTKNIPEKNVIFSTRHKQRCFTVAADHQRVVGRFNIYCKYGAACPSL